VIDEQSSGDSRRENADACLSAVIARSEATKQSRVVCVALDCRVASLLAMTTLGLFENWNLERLLFCTVIPGGPTGPNHGAQLRT